MTVTNTTYKSQYNGNGSTTAFSTVFQFQTSDQVKVIRTQISTGIDTVMTNPTNFSVAGGAGSAGTVTMVVAPTTDQRITIYRDDDYLQGTNYQQYRAFPSDETEKSLDELTFQTVQLRDKVKRSAKLKESTLSSLDVYMDDPSANKGLKWNATADAIINTTGDPDDAVIDAAASAAAAAASAAAAATSESNAADSETNAAASETAAGISETNAAASETAAGVSETNAAASAVSAENSALSVGARLVSTSTTSMSIGTGAKTCTVQTAEGWAVGMFITVYRTSDITQFMVGQITAYNTGTGQLDFSVTSGNTNGSGTYTDWTIVVGGRRGVDGSAAGTVFASATDTTQNFLTNKLTVSGNIIKNLVNGGGNESINLEAVIKVKQVQFGTLATSFSTGSGTFQDTGLTASITPSSASNKVIVIYSGLVKMESGLTPSIGEIKALRGASTDIEGNSNYLRFGIGIASTNTYDIATRVIVDSPATTSSTSYKVQIRAVTVAGDNTAVFCESGSGFLVLIEYEP